VILSVEEVLTILGRVRLPRYRVCLGTIYSCGLRLQEGTHTQATTGDQQVQTASHEETGLRLKDEAVEGRWKLAKESLSAAQATSGKQPKKGESLGTQALIKVQSALRVPAQFNPELCGGLLLRQVMVSNDAPHEFSSCCTNS